MAWELLEGRNPKFWERNEMDELRDRFTNEVINHPKNDGYVSAVRTSSFKSTTGLVEPCLIADVDNSRECPGGLVLWDVFYGVEVCYKPCKLY